MHLSEQPTPQDHDETPYDDGSPPVFETWRRDLFAVINAHRTDFLIGILLLVVLASGYWLRSTGRNWDDFTHLHPDERFLTDVASRVGDSPLRFAGGYEYLQEVCNERYPAPSSDELAGLSIQEQQERVSKAGKGGYFDAECSDLNPNNIGFGLYVYGQFPMFSTRISAETVSAIELEQCLNDAGVDDLARAECESAQRLSNRTGYGGIHLVGRTVSSIADTVTILIVFLLGLKLFGRWQGLLGAALYAFAAFPIQQSHFWTVDAFTTLWSMLTVYAAVNVLDHDAHYPAKFSPLAWLAAAMGLWIFELPRLEAVSFAPLIIYAGAFGLACGAIILHRHVYTVALGVSLGAGLMLFGLIIGQVTLIGVIVGLVVMALLAAFVWFGMNDLAAFGGTTLWLMAAFGLWVFDGLAHYDSPSLTPLLLYLVVFAIGGMMASALYRSQSRESLGRNAVLFGLPLTIWVMTCALLGAISWQGMVWVLLLTYVMVAGVAFGYRDYLAFGVAFGAALAGRVNVAPLVGLLFLAILIRSLPILDRRTYITERYRLATRAMLGLMLAGALTILFFRLLQPHAFVGFYSDAFNAGIIPAGFNDGWMDDISEAQHLVSGESDIPPNHQWASRIPWVFPAQNMLLWGMGVAFGVVGWFAFFLALWRVLRAKAEWVRLALPVAWITVYFGWLGQNWVTTMRYFLPLYGIFAILAGWLLVNAVQKSYLAFKLQPSGRYRLAFGASTAILALVLGYTALYGLGMANLHRTILTRTAASIWFQDNVPGNLGVWIETEDGDYRLQNIGTTRTVSPPSSVLMRDTEDGMTLPVSFLNDVEIESVVLHRVTDIERDEGDEEIRVSIQRVDGVSFPVTVAERTLEADFAEGLSDFGDEYSVFFNDEETPTEIPSFPPGAASPAEYALHIEVLRGEVAFSRNVSDSVLPMTFDHVTLHYRTAETGEVFVQSFSFDEVEEAAPYTYYMPSQRGAHSFVARADGVISQIDIPHVTDPLHDVDAENLQIELQGPGGTVSYGGVERDFTPPQDGINNLGAPVSIRMEPPLTVQQGETYTLYVVADSPLVTLGNVVATEGPWDDPLPYKVCPLPDGQLLARSTPSGYSHDQCIGMEMFGSHYYGRELYIVAEDNENKRNILTTTLDEADYLTISSNRFYDTLNRIPSRWPLTLDYYDALFSGELGFELVLEWDAYPSAFGITWKNQVLPTDDLPRWMNEFEAEEAFHVYNHPAIFVFKKTDAYDPQRTREILSTPVRQYTDVFGGLGADALPANRNVITAPDATDMPNGLMMTDIAAEQNAATGWRDLFNPDALINQNQAVAVAVWWLFIVVLGWLAFPFMFAIFPGLPDRGFGASKFLGLLLVTWLAWMGGSFHMGTWSRLGIGLCIVLLALVSLGFLWPRRREFRQFLRERRLYLIFIEVLTFALFGFFLYVRYRNPDLWHNSFGGEKPMDFAYLNAILRSNVFPPLDPWFAGGYINYYYWGWVLTGMPMKFLGVVPALGYNLAIPTLFAMTGIGAFSIAYNLVGARLKHMPAANPYVAGIAALMLVAVLGNLDTVRVFTTEVAKMGGWGGTASYDLAEERRQSLLSDFVEDNGRQPDAEELAAIMEQAENPPYTVKVAHSITGWRDMTEGFANGIDRVLQGEPIPMATHRWYWAPTRVIAELPDGRGHNAINEMPYFTFLYGDLHPHMIAMPMILMVLLWLTGEVLSAGRKRRGAWALGGALFVGALSVGMLRATNTWDFPTFMILGVAGLTYVAWAAQRERISALDEPPPTIYETLIRYLDWRLVANLWWMLFALPIGVALYGLNWFVNWRAYEANVEAGLVPFQCQNLPDDIAFIPASCDGFLEPSLSLLGAAAWAFGLLALVAVGFIFALVALRDRFDRIAFSAWIGRLVAFGLGAMLVVAPFTYWESSEAGLTSWDRDRTPLWAYVDIHGLFLFILGSFLLWQTVRLLKDLRVHHLRGLGVPVLLVLAGIPAVLLAAVVIGIDSVPVMAVTLPMIAWASVLFLVPNTSHTERVVYALMVLALGITTGVEIVVVDVDIGRQNMVFKFYMQAWLLFGVSSGVALAMLLDDMFKWQSGLRFVWQTALALLVTTAILYPVMATQARWEDRFDATRTGNTLDGLAYMQYAVYGDNGVWFNTRGDYHMINWLNENIEGTPTIIEAQTTEYKRGARIAINTGLPTVMGWNWHQRQQRNVFNLNNAVWNRTNNVAAFYETPDIATAWNLIEHYEIELIILGVQERVTYNDLDADIVGSDFDAGRSAGLAKFDRMVELGLLEVIYEAPTCVEGGPTSVEDCPESRIVMDKVYRVVEGASYQPLVSTPEEVGR